MVFLLVSGHRALLLRENDPIDNKETVGLSASRPISNIVV